jgi:hypothetical protein
MISEPQLIELLQPAVSAILEVDAKAVTQVANRREVYSNLDPQPAATAMALERRAIVATEMRRQIAPEFGWILIEENLESGAYEWLVGNTVVRLSKTNRESRLEDAKAALRRQGVQGTLFDATTHPAGPRDEVMIRLLGNALRSTTVDAVALKSRGELGTPILLRTIAEMNVEHVVPASAPRKVRITVPGTRRTSESG